MTYKKFIIANSFFFLGAGMSGLFWIVKMNEMLGTHYIGIAVGLSIIAQAVTSFLVGKWVKNSFTTLILSQIGFSILTFLPVFDPSFYSIFLIELALGIVIAIQLLCSSIIITQLDEKIEKGFGYFYCAQGIITGISMLGGSIINSLIGIKSVFILGSILIFISSILLWITKNGSK